IPQGVHADGAKCVLRLRYNISTYDFKDSWSTFSSSNGANAILRTNPKNDFVGLGESVSGPIRLNVNTAQFGRTFQDRSHVFQIRKRPGNLPCGLRANNDCNIYNLNVRGRRGNIVQVYPSVEYDFVPSVLVTSKNDYVHIQWTGSDANDQNNNGNGRTGTDRSNMAILPSLGGNVPTNINPLVPTNSTPLHFSNDFGLIGRLAYLNQTGCNSDQTDTNQNDYCPLMNRASAYQNFGLVRMENIGTYHVVSTRNNAFSNREQKSTVIVSEDVVTVVAATSITVGGIALISALGVAGLFYARRNPNSRLANIYRLANRSELESGDTLDDDASSQGDLLENSPTLYERYPWLGAVAEWYAWNKPRVMFGVFFSICI
ncbi:hypothetical protein HDU91_002963, partial [Kappamyces sp. JEL0680]